MGTESAIEWTVHTFNPWSGCTRVSPGCEHCYAEKLAKRNPTVLGEWGPRGRRIIKKHWRDPVRWNRQAQLVGERQRVFCASMSDVFEGRETMPKGDWAQVEAARVRLFELIAETPSLDWLLLTKRTENIEKLWPRALAASPVMVKRGRQKVWGNIWLGTSVESRKQLHRIDTLRKIPAAIRFLSIEPQIEDLGTLNLKGIDWVIVGGESGALANVRPFQVEWAEDIVAQCRAAGVAEWRG